MNYNADEVGAEMWYSFEVPGALPYMPSESVNFDEMNIWNTPNAGIVYGSNENPEGLAQFEDTFQGLGQETLQDSSWIQQGGHEIFSERLGPNCESVQLTESATVSADFPSIASSSLSPTLSSPVPVSESILQPLLERIEALEAAQSVATLSDAQTSRSCSQSSSCQDRPHRAISRIAHFKPSKFVSLSRPRATHSDFRTDRPEQEHRQRFINASICLAML